MSILVVDTLVQQAKQLSEEEQLLLMSRLIETMQQQRAATVRHKWQSIRGSVQMPLVGEDAQTWVSRTRREGDAQREQQWHHA